MRQLLYVCTGKAQRGSSQDGTRAEWPSICFLWRACPMRGLTKWRQIRGELGAPPACDKHEVWRKPKEEGCWLARVAVGLALRLYRRLRKIVSRAGGRREWRKPRTTVGCLYWPDGETGTLKGVDFCLFTSLNGKSTNLVETLKYSNLKSFLLNFYFSRLFSILSAESWWSQAQDCPETNSHPPHVLKFSSSCFKTNIFSNLKIFTKAAFLWRVQNILQTKTFFNPHNFINFPSVTCNGTPPLLFLEENIKFHKV